MSLIVGVHGIGQQSKSSEKIHSEWFPALRGGIQAAGGYLSDPTSLQCAFYGDLFRATGTKSVGGEWVMDDLTEPWEQQFAALLDGELAGKNWTTG